MTAPNRKTSAGLRDGIAFTTALPLLIAEICSSLRPTLFRKNSCSLEFDCEKLETHARSITESAALVTSLPHFRCRKLLICIMAFLLRREVSGCRGIQVGLAQHRERHECNRNYHRSDEQPEGPERLHTPQEREKHE